jgi:hypothetical protein
MAAAGASISSGFVSRQPLTRGRRANDLAVVDEDARRQPPAECRRATRASLGVGRASSAVAGVNADIVRAARKNGAPIDSNLSVDEKRNPMHIRPAFAVRALYEVARAPFDKPRGASAMEVGKPIRTYTVEPLRDPVPQVKPLQKPSQQPQAQPAGSPRAPAR